MPNREVGSDLFGPLVSGVFLGWGRSRGLAAHRVVFAPDRPVPECVVTTLEGLPFGRDDPEFGSDLGFVLAKACGLGYFDHGISRFLEHRSPGRLVGAVTSLDCRFSDRTPGVDAPWCLLFQRFGFGTPPISVVRPKPAWTARSA